MQQLSDYRSLISNDSAFQTITIQTTQKPPEERVGEEWPRLLSKKWIAIHFGCYNGQNVLWRRFRSHVLTPEVLQNAGIDQDFAYSRHCKTFNAIQSMKLTQILRGFCFLAFLLTTTFSTAQTGTSTTVEYSGDKFVNDTIPGMAMITDSIIRMVQVGTGFRYEKVLTGIVVDAYMVKQHRFLVRSSDGGHEPFDLTQSFHLLTGGLIDPKRIMIFKQSPK